MSEGIKLSPAMKLAVEAGPLLVFFIANAAADIFWATGLFMLATALSLGFSWAKTGRVALVPLIGGVFVAVFGVLTLWLHDDTFIKVKVTLVNGLFGSVLTIGLLFRRSFLQSILGETLRLDDAGWRKLTLRWALFFFAIALANEAVWRSFDTSIWINFKVFALLPLTFIFAICQVPLMQRHELSGKGPQS